MRRHDSPATRPREISSRSATASTVAPRWRSTGACPPVLQQVAPDLRLRLADAQRDRADRVAPAPEVPHLRLLVQRESPRAHTPPRRVIRTYEVVRGPIETAPPCVSRRVPTGELARFRLSRRLPGLVDGRRPG